MGKIKFRHNAMNINSIKSFYSVKGGCNHQVRDVYFIRTIGEMPDLNHCMREADQQMDLEMAQGKLTYKRISSLPLLKDFTDSEFYVSLFLKFEKKESSSFRKIPSNRELENVIIDAVSEIIKIYKELKTNLTSSMIQNFGTKLLFWLDQEMGTCFSSWSETSCIKVVSDNVVKEQEYLFYLFLTYLGCDVLLIQNRRDIVGNDKMLQYSNEIFLGNFGHTMITPYCPQVSEHLKDTKHGKQKKENTQNHNIEEKQSIRRVVIPEKPNRKNRNGTENRETTTFGRRETTLIHTTNREKSYEELAQLASSVVLIKIHNQDGDVVGSGSGIMIGKKGYILTNHHVTSDGYFYSVKIEDDEETYLTNEVIKYNSVLDLAVIRIQRQLNPIPIYQGQHKLVRGQKVVAIGSPLGLFNSVSDGIISGFRNIHDVDMIQFTAPTSRGSSGGAVLNMQGEVIGISTSGIDHGQNINLAIGYENIQLFINGFID